MSAVCSRRILSVQRFAYRPQGLFLDARDVAAADAALLRDLPLCQRRAAAQAVAQGDDRLFARRKDLFHDGAQLAVQLACAEILEKILLRADRVHEGQRAAVPPGLDAVRERNILRALSLRTKIHQDLIFYASGSIGRQSRALTGVEGRDAFDEPNRADGDQILLIGGLCIVFFHDVRHQPEVALDQDVSRGQIALCGQLQIVPLLGGGERLWKGAACACQMQGTEHAAEHEPDSGRKHGNLTSCKECIPRRLVQIPHFPRGQALTEAEGR